MEPQFVAAQEVIQEVVDETKRLGRHIRHDIRSRDFHAYQLIPEGATVKSQIWRRHALAYDQGNLGSCTGNAMAGLLMTEPFFKPSRRLSETDAITMYSQATKLDPLNGESYPPTDTGSTGLDVMKAAKNDGYISAYHHAFDFPSVCLYVANVGPAICGINWYDSFDSPDSNGVVKITPGAYVRGGHEPQIQGIDASSRYIRLVNSWGPDWGDHGCFQLSFTDFDRLLNEQGDVTLAVK